MTTIERDAGDFVIDAELLAAAFGLLQDEIKARMRNGAITSRCETGIDEDAGRWRLTFQHADRACRFVVDEAGNVLTRTMFPVESRPAGPAARDGDPATTSAGPGTAR